jgi:hypothetical protein
MKTNQPGKMWWHGEPLMAEGLRWRIIENDLIRTMRETLNQYEQTKAAASGAGAEVKQHNTTK